MNGKDFIEWTLKSEGINYVKEFKFLKDRKFRFDFYLPDYALGIEYEGIFAGKSRHTSVMGYSKDTEKYNLATLNGYRILRYTAMNYKKFTSDLNILHG